jgi:Na+/phosphate symporter
LISSKCIIFELTIKANDMNYTQILEVKNKITSLDRKINNLYRDYSSLETQQEKTKDEDLYILIIQKLDEVNSKIMEISSEREILIDSI